MLKDTKSLGNNKAPACESRGFVHKKEVCILTHLLFVVGLPGLEPGMTGPESVVLPLHHSPIIRFAGAKIQIFCKIKLFRSFFLQKS